MAGGGARIGERPARVGADGLSGHDASVGDVGVGGHVRGAQPHQQFAGHSVAPPVTLGVLRSHVAPADPGRPHQHLVERHVPLRWHEIPLPLPSAQVDLRWHRRLDEDIPSQWLRNHVRASVKPLVVQLGTMGARTAGTVA